MNESKKKILIVEDEQSYQNILIEKLKKEDFEILLAQNGEEGLKIALETHPDLILLDIQMPQMDGIEMAKNLRVDKWGEHVKIIIISNISDVDKIRQALQNKVFEYFLKTETKLEDLITRIKEVLF